MFEDLKYLFSQIFIDTIFESKKSKKQRKSQEKYEAYKELQQRRYKMIEMYSTYPPGSPCPDCGSKYPNRECYPTMTTAKLRLITYSHQI